MVAPLISHWFIHNKIVELQLNKVSIDVGQLMLKKARVGDYMTIGIAKTLDDSYGLWYNIKIFFLNMI